MWKVFLLPDENRSQLYNPEEITLNINYIKKRHNCPDKKLANYKIRLLNL